jgi:preprotein translocase subunit SecE
MMKKNFLKRIKDYLLEIKSELKKVTWPAKPDIQKTSIAVIVSSLIFGIYLYGVDAFFGIIIQNIMNVF